MSETGKSGGGVPGADHGESYRVEVQVGHVLRRAHQRASALFQAHIGDDNITPTQFAALVKLRDQPGVSQNLLGRLTAMDPATTQGVIRRLKARGLVEATSDPSDARRTLLRLSGDGEALVARLVPNGFNVSQAILEPLSEDERRQLRALLDRIS